ncbi:MAG: hypothetical protein JWO13_2455 [Acidobacteriales bacterium]|nr:hypothetical protein [Terriglobales bacterium]
MSFRTCIHLKVNGQQCQSPALRNSTHCHFHHQHRRMKRRQINIEKFDSNRARLDALHKVMNAVLQNRLDPEVARTLLYGIANSYRL